MAKTVKRLYEQFRPQHYDLSITFNDDKSAFGGTVKVCGRKVGRPSKRLTFHQKDLKITDVNVVHKNKKGDKTTIAIDRVNRHNSYDEIRLHSQELLYPGEYEISLGFSGTVTKPMNGIYPCFFKDGGVDKQLIATQFESHHAREAFPCIDEPEAKATFSLTLTTPKGETVLSNTPVKRQKTSGKSTVTQFEPTPLMSSYLLAFVFGELKYLEKKTKSGIKVRTYATPANTKHTEFALDIAVKCLEFYNEYFGIPYPLEKCDFIALPDFASGAMENWGCITFREQTMLVDPHNTSLTTKQYVAMVVAHELAHQWFGNLVTMRWWTDLWLNEGFASWIEYLAVDHMFPQWDMWTQFITDEQHAALKQDALENTHPIEVPIKHPDEIRTIFDIISYQKGSSVIHMLNNYLGDSVFRDGLRYYLKKHAHGNTDTVDLWNALEEVSGKPVKDFMETWVTKPGYPIIHANISETTLECQQERFYLNRNNLEQKTKHRWQVPLLANIGGVRELLENGGITQEVDDPIHLKLNSNHSGFYRVVYNASHTHELADLVRRGKLGPLDRLGLLSDSFEAAKASYVDTDDALDLLTAFLQETNSAVWDVIARNLGDMRAILGADNDLRQVMKPFERMLTAAQVERLGWKPKKDESHFDTLLRPTILGLASLADNEEVVKESLKLFKSMHHPDDVSSDLREGATSPEVKKGMLDPDIRGVVYGTAARKGDEHTFDKLWKMHEATDFSEERLNLTAALTSFHQKPLIKKSLSLILTDSVRHQDISYWVAYSFMNRYGRELTWKWLKENWDWLHKNLGTDLSFARMPIYAARVFSSKEFLKDYKSFFAHRSTPALERSIKQGIEVVEWHIDWRQRAEKEVLAFFKAQK